MKKIKKILLLTLLLFPSVVYASSSEAPSISFFIFMELFVSIHMSVFVLMPLSQILKPENSKSLFINLFITRAIVLLFFDFTGFPEIALFDFFAVFIGAFVAVPAIAAAKKVPFNVSTSKKISIPLGNNNTNTLNDNTNTINGIKSANITCNSCGAPVSVLETNCSYCGSPINRDTINVEPIETNINKVTVSASDFDPIYAKTENDLVTEFLKSSLTKAGIDLKSKLIPEEILKRKKILSIIFSILLFVFITMIFFHFPLATYIVGLIILLIAYRLTVKYNLIKYLTKEIKARPNEKISNIIMSVKGSFVEDDSRKIRVVGFLIAVFLPLIVFINPVILYEKVDGGYAVRYYAFGLTNYTTATIPAIHNGEPVISLRGNTFSNMPFLREVELPDTVVEIRGQAFKNDYSLTKVNIPSNLQYLGGGAFYNCTMIESVILPDSLTYMGGEAFYGASNLKEIKLSKNLYEIRGDTFEYCTSLKEIEIPDSVTRIGGHAFYGDYELSEVKLTKDSKLTEIGSSAFRQCNNLYTITIPRNTYVNERAFKESPTSIRYFGVDYSDEDNLYFDDTDIFSDSYSYESPYIKYYQENVDEDLDLNLNNVIFNFKFYKTTTPNTYSIVGNFNKTFTDTFRLQLTLYDEEKQVLDRGYCSKKEISYFNQNYFDCTLYTDKIDSVDSIKVYLLK